MARIRKYLPPAQTICIDRYTWKSWLRTYSQTNEDEWISSSLPYNIYDFLDFIISSMEQNGIQPQNNDEMKVVVLDDDYFKYLEKNKLKNTQEERSNYITSLKCSDAELMQKAVKEGLDKAYTLLTIPIIMARREVSGTSTNFKLTPEQTSELTKYLESIYGKDNVYVYGYFVKLEEIEDNLNKLIANGNLYFTKNIKFDIPEYKKQRYQDKVSIAFLGIPFLVKVPVEKMVFKYDELLNIFNSVKYNPAIIENLDNDDFSLYNIKAKNFVDTKIYNELSKNKSLNIVPIQLPDYEIKDFIKTIIQQFF